MVRHFAIASLAFAFVVIMNGVSVGSQARKDSAGQGSVKIQQQLTCSFIAEQCLTECPKRASAMFCESYCTNNQKSCLNTGRWNGLVQQFEDVERR